LSDVAEHIHIRSVYLAAIEDEDWATIGAPVYARGFIRSYARFLNLDGDAAVAQFAARIPDHSPGHAAAALAAKAAASGERSGPSVGAIAGMIIALALLAFVGYEYVVYRQGTPGPSAAATPVALAPSPAAPSATPAAAADSPAPADTTAGDPSPRPTAIASPAAKNGIQIRLTERSWVRVVVDGTTAMEGIFPAGTVRSFAGKTASVRAGNAAGVEVSVAGRPQGALGATGDVVERSYTLSHPE
jgi:hypothetical protein